MKDPAPSNITGEKTVSHVIEHTVRWDYLALGAAAIYAVYKLGQFLDGEEIEEPAGEIVEVEENNQGTGLRTEV